MSLDGTQLAQLHRALLSAFPTPTALERLVRYRLDRNLAEIAGSGSLADVVFRLIQQVEAEGGTAALLTAALAENPGNPALRAFAEQIGQGPAAAPPAALGAPARGKLGIAIDLSHGQGQWDAHSLFNAVQGRLDTLLYPPPAEPPWDLRPIRDRRQLRADELRDWPGLLFGIPHHERIAETTRYEIATWVRQGGRLVLLGFELGERHHETNLNELAAEFGLRFNSDMVAPRDWAAPGKPYARPVHFTGLAGAHPLLAGVGTLCLWNCCTLTVEPGADVVLTVGENALARLQPDGVRYSSQGWLRGGSQQFEVIAEAGWLPVIAEAPEGLVGAGRVLAIGTWELLGPRFAVPPGADNLRFVTNLFNWLGGR